MFKIKMNVSHTLNYFIITKGWALPIWPPIYRCTCDQTFQHFAHFFHNILYACNVLYQGLPIIARFRITPFPFIYEFVNL